MKSQLGELGEEMTENKKAIVKMKRPLEAKKEEEEEEEEAEEGEEERRGRNKEK